MTEFIALLAVALLAAGCVFVYRASLRRHVECPDELDWIRSANRELRDHRLEATAWADAVRLAGGDEGVARARYLELRVKQMRTTAAASRKSPSQPAAQDSKP